MRNKLFAAVIPVVLLLASCLKDKAYKTYTYTLYRPVYKTADNVRANVKSSAPHNITSSGKMYISGDYIFLSENGLGVHIINNADPAHPANEGYINIPGCTDIAAKGNILYADCYTDLLTIDISNPKDVKLKNYTPNLFPDRQYVLGYKVDSGNVIAEWIIKDTTVTEAMALNMFEKEMIVFSSNSSVSSGALNSSSGRSVSAGGSMARFAIVSNKLYTVTTSSLNVINIEQALQPTWQKTIQLGWLIETIYPFKDNLFIGSADGMHIVNISDPSNPKAAGVFTHARVCDPVIAEDKYAYVTLRSGTTCAGFTNQMDVVDVSNINSPTLTKSYPLTNPRGLSKDGKLLFVCEGPNYVKVFNADIASAITEIGKMEVAESYDVICLNGIAIITAKDGLYQYSYTPSGETKLLSKMSIVK